MVMTGGWFIIVIPGGALIIAGGSGSYSVNLMKMDEYLEGLLRLHHVNMLGSGFCIGGFFPGDAA